LQGQAAIFSRATDEWATPQWLFDKLNEEFHFTLDVCANEDNAKCKTFFSKVQDGLQQQWDGVIWCNPPYGRQIKQWVKKASEAAASGNTVVMLIPARTDTEWFHEYVYGKAEIRFIRGRVKFGGSKYNAPFPSMICVFRNY
jgi:site-specific DNA-methyltransferase (adenine-specific)